MMPSKKQRAAPDPRFKQTVQQVAPGISLLTYSDVMSEGMSLRISFPPYGPYPSSEDVVTALSKFGNAGWNNTLDQVRTYLAGGSNVDASVDHEPLSAPAMGRHAQHLLEGIEKMLEPLDPALRPDMEKALAFAFRLGGTIAEMRLREQHLLDVARETKVAAGRRSGGESRKGKLKESTAEILRFMDEQSAKGRSPREAALDANIKGHGTSHDANYRLYRRYRLGSA
jgi:hypothetical protein